MKLPLYLSLFLTTLLLSSCGVVEGIFKAGMWWAFILIGIVIAVILWVISKAKK